MNADQIRKKYLDFMIKKGYTKIEPVELILEGDATTLFTGSGMQPMIPYLLGKTHPTGNLLTNSQPCLRMQDMDEVGDNRHTTLFEMLGDWSLDGFSKDEQIHWLFEFLTGELGLDPERLYVTCFIGDEANGIPRDNETATIWQQVFDEQGIKAKTAEIGSMANGNKRGMKPDERIFFYDDKQNWWSRNGGINTTPQGDPCGPDNEVFYDFGESAHDPSFGQAHPASDSGRFVEICNKVWMQYQRQDDGRFKPLTKGKVDFGGGLSRLASAVMGAPDIFMTSLYQPIIAELEQMSGREYAANQAPMRVIADHLTAAVWLASQGLVPSNKEQGYAMRRLVRRAILKALDLGIESNFLNRLTKIIVEIYSKSYPQFRTASDKIVEVLELEENTFRKTLAKGLRELGKFAADGLTGAELFMLHDTYGFPLELSVEEAYRQNIKLSVDWRSEFDKAMQQQRERSQTATKGVFKGGLEDHGEMTTKLHSAAHLMLAAMHKVLSPNVEQKGSNITAERLRFDFSWPEKLTPEQIQAIEDQVNAWIVADLPVTHDEYDKDYAFDTLHAHGSFRDKYGDKVTVYQMGDASCEICGGPHVEHTGQLAEGGKKFQITKEESSSAGVRRIKAVLR